MKKEGKKRIKTVIKEDTTPIKINVQNDVCSDIDNNVNPYNAASVHYFITDDPCQAMFDCENVTFNVQRTHAINTHAFKSRYNLDYNDSSFIQFTFFIVITI